MRVIYSEQEHNQLVKFIVSQTISNKKTTTIGIFIEFVAWSIYTLHVLKEMNIIGILFSIILLAFFLFFAKEMWQNFNIENHQILTKILNKEYFVKRTTEYSLIQRNYSIECNSACNDYINVLIEGFLEEFYITQQQRILIESIQSKDKELPLLDFIYVGENNVGCHSYKIIAVLLNGEFFKDTLIEIKKCSA